MMGDPRVLFGILSLVALAAAVLPYFIGIARGTIKPHMFSWLLWTLTMGITGIAQWSQGAGPGAWAMLAGAALNLVVVALAIRYGEKHITRSDWIMLTAGLCAIPLWFFTHDPLWSVILVTSIDIAGYGPTFRKAWSRPQEEGAMLFVLSTGWTLASLFAMHDRALVNVLAPTAYAAANIALVSYLIIRRRALGISRI
jgi:hypothetical protein